ncbi:MAG TPA: glycosyltransferase family 2 protein [Burkholderiaceae bacterium]|nr:glycosyltransferase family 2 protein [Burkholderiaceae bacterium]
MSIPLLSVTVITRNEAHRIARCLGSVSFADEWVVLDSGSTDDTVAIARSLGARVHQSADWPGFGPQKNRALDAAAGQWVLSLDADEVVGPELASAIRAVMARAARGEEVADAYWIERSSRYCGRTIRFGDWRNDRVLRLFRRGRARFSDDLVHERLICPGRHPVLAGQLEHDSVDSPADAREKSERYARLGAVKLRARGRGGLTSALTHGAWTFLRGYLLRLGALDGRAGLAIAWLNARGTFLRYRLAGEPAPERTSSGDSA